MSRTPRLQPNRALDFRWGTEVQTLAVDWVCEPWLARGVVAVLDGDPGLGKSSLALDLVARVTAARPFPGADDAVAPREPQTPALRAGVVGGVQPGGVAWRLRPDGRRAGAAEGDRVGPSAGGGGRGGLPGVGPGGRRPAVGGAGGRGGPGR